MNVRPNRKTLLGYWQGPLSFPLPASLLSTHILSSATQFVRPFLYNSQALVDRQQPATTDQQQQQQASRRNAHEAVPAMPNATVSFCIALIIACAIQAQGRPLHTYARGGASAFATSSNGEGVKVVSWDNGDGDAGTSIIKYSGAQEEEDVFEDKQHPADSTAAEPDFFEQISQDPPVSPQHTDVKEDDNQPAADTPAHSTQGDEVNDADLQAVLDTHNRYRARFGAAPLSWSSRIASGAHAYSANCVFEHSGADGLGENLSWNYKSWAAAIRAWMEDEEGLYDYNNQGFSHETAHFTQVVWKATTELGCGASSCGGEPLYVCRYSPPSVQNAYEENVSRPVS